MRSIINVRGGSNISLITAMESAFCIVDNRCATIKHVLPTIIFSSASWTRFSEALSSALVALVHPLLSLLLCIFFYSLFFLLFCLLTHSCNSARLHLVLSLTCWDFTSFSLCPNGRMASPFYFFHLFFFSSFHTLHFKSQ